MRNFQFFVLIDKNLIAGSLNQTSLNKTKNLQLQHVYVLDTQNFVYEC